MVATYQGDSNYGPSTSGIVSMTAPQGKSAVSLALLPNPVSYGALATMTATVTGKGLQPTGTVTFNGISPLGTGTLSGGVASYATSALVPGTYSITASYSGDIDYFSASSTTNYLTVNKGTPSVALTASANSVAPGSPVTLVASLTGSVAVPSGTVTFMDGTTQLAVWPLSRGAASYTTSTLALGTHSITAKYSGNLYYTAAASTALTVTVTNGLTAAIQLTATPGAIAYGASVNLTAALTGNGAVPSGSVSFFDGATPLGTGALNSAGTAALAVTSLAVGTHSVTASYGGDKNYGPITSAPLTLVVGKAAQTIAFTAPASPLSYGASPLKLVASASSGLPVSFSATGPATLSGATLTVTGAGTVVVTASQGGNGNYLAAAPVAHTVQVNKATLTATADSISVAYNQVLPALTYSLSGFVAGDTAKVVSGTALETTTARQGSAPGSYPVALAQGTLSAANYSFQMKNGTLTILSLGIAATPAFSLKAGTYDGTQTVMLFDATAGAGIHYTTNGTAPTAGSTLYTGAITLNSTETIEAIAVAAGYANSAVAKAAYIIQAPAAALSATTVAFGSQKVGTVSAVKTVTLTNSGNAALLISGFELTGANAASFFVSENCGASVAVGASCRISMLFFPAARGAATAALILNDNAGSSPQRILLTGAGQ